MNSPRGSTQRRNNITRQSMESERKVDLSLCTVGAQPKLPLKMEHLSLGVETMLSPERGQRISSPRKDELRDEGEDYSR